jgi:GNAT superfamily N-acetyltransferase
VAGAEAVMAGGEGLQAHARQAALADLEDLARLFDAYRVFYGCKRDQTACSQFLLERFKHGESILFLAFQKSRAVGFCQLYPTFSSVSLARVFILNDLYVEEHARRQGFGALLLRHAADYAQAVGAIRLSLSTGIQNALAQDLYEKSGWRRDTDFHVYHCQVSAPVL